MGRSKKVKERGKSEELKKSERSSFSEGAVTQPTVGV
jgi:hypothetical protein